MNIAKPYGLIMCGGNSSRMGIDKSKLIYHSKPQRYYLYEMLKPVCEKVFISCNEEQAAGMQDGYEFITDLPYYKNIGPMAGLLSAFRKFPEQQFLITGCDYPFLDARELERFISSIKGEEKPCTFHNKAENIYEPLLGYYPSTSFEPLKKMFTDKQYSLQSFLRRIDAGKYFPLNEKSICSIDTYEAHLKARDQFTEQALENYDER